MEATGPLPHYSPESIQGRWKGDRPHPKRRGFIVRNGVGKEFAMLWTLFVILLVLWAVGLLTGYTMGGILHALLVIAIIVILVQVLQGRKRI
jgi:Flp pilus assembly protein TadB